MIDKNTNININAPSLDCSKKEIILNIQKTLLLTLYENKKLDFNQYQYAVKLLEKKFMQR